MLDRHYNCDLCRFRIPFFEGGMQGRGLTYEPYRPRVVSCEGRPQDCEFHLCDACFMGMKDMFKKFDGGG